MSHSSSHSPTSTPAPVADDSIPATQISPPPRAPPTPPPDSDPSSPRINSNAADFPAIPTASSSPSQSTLTSFPMSSPAWFPPFDATSLESPLVPSSSSATLVDSCLSPTASPPSKSIQAPSFSHPSSPEIVHEIKQSTLEEGEVVSQLSEAEVLMKDLGLKDPVHVSKDTESGQTFADSPVLPSQPHISTSPPRAPSRPTIPLPPVDSDPPHFSAPRQREDSARVHKNNESSVPPPAEPEKTPNVYINGLPPNFPEDQLFALAAPFGEVRSVRSFTRHVGDAETGYGFVLSVPPAPLVHHPSMTLTAQHRRFETIASAEKCINSLRRYRNLHPTFSKVHKIPGTMYSQPRPASDHAASVTPSASSLAGWEQESAGDGSADSTFKAKMERLADKQSTNLYIEGLPLSIDEATLAALVSPYSIRSSRFFQTKLSSPPRIIAFVRLETRNAAEEIIERLHGRMVRGWNDPGSRISVRFADTSEQRELRRTERLAREGDQASNQLSIAQATLLNLRGKELHARAPIAAAPMDDYSDGYSDFQSNASQFQSNANQFQAGPYPASDFEVDYSRVPARYPHTLPAQPSLNHFAQQNLPAHSASQSMNPAMASLLDSLQASGAAFRDRTVYAQDPMAYRTLQQQQLASLSNSQNLRSYVPQGLGIAPAQHAHPGYTATEEFILRARSNSLPQKRRPVPLDLNQAQARQHHELESAAANINMGVRGYRAQASTLSFPHQHQHGLSSIFDPQDSMNEEEFHAASSIPHQMQAHRPQQQFDNGDRIINQLNAHSLHTQQQHTNTARIPRNQPPHQQQHLHQHLPASSRAPSQSHDFGPHARNQPLPATQQTHHYQHSLPPPSNAQHARNNMTNIRPAQANNMMNMNTTTNNTSSLGNSHGIYEHTAREATQRRHNGAGGSYNGPHMYSSGSDVDQSSPPLVSPALTYSSRSSVAFSPTTPFFGAFDEDETFRAPQMDGKGKKINSRTATR
ncbi:hypothetical protein B0H17DRAFT_1212343 [Mycena rosella]|uniref:RRM domain-containing protein n=1 Tax=Mycena rosella TaxID=1033263 RepID=A0AAD7CSR7_MYCRO|nr:hypothetical protein B0H17DRAFT_1212343 [Mycena rosella]